MFYDGKYKMFLEGKYSTISTMFYPCYFMEHRCLPAGILQFKSWQIDTHGKFYLKLIIGLASTLTYLKRYTYGAEFWQKIWRRLL